MTPAAGETESGRWVGASPLLEGKHVYVPEITQCSLYDVRSVRRTLPNDGLALSRAATIEGVTDHRKSF